MSNELSFLNENYDFEIGVTDNTGQLRVEVNGGTVHNVIFGEAPTVTWEPKEDITAYELALCLPLILYAPISERQLEILPDRARRHFKKVERSAIGDIVYP